MLNCAEKPVFLPPETAQAPAENDVMGLAALKLQEPLMFETWTRSVLRFSDRSLVDELTHPPAIPDSALGAFQQLVDVAKELKSLGAPSSPDQSFSPEQISAYVAEEAQDVLDALLLASPSEVSADSTQSSTIILEALIPTLLWAIARNSFQVMQLIEGVEASACLPGQPWEPGIFRLMVQLELETADWKGCFDLVTGRSSPLAMPSNLLVQAETAVLPQPFSAFDQIQAVSQDSTWQRQLLSLHHQIQHNTPALEPWFEGLTVEILQPGSDWQMGTLTLKLDFEFLENILDCDRPEFQSSVCAVDAELLDDGDPANQQIESAIACSNYSSVTILELADEPDFTTAIVQMADPEIQAKYAVLSLQQEFLRSLHHCQRSSSTDSEIALASVFQAACRLSELPPVALSNTFSLLQPEFLMDELVPKLLWQITRNSYEVMQLVGGVSANLLLPDSGWDQGNLRLLPVLEISTATESGWIDLATGRLILDTDWQMPPLAIAQLIAHPITVCLQPIQLDLLLTHLEQLIGAAAPELALLLAGIAIEWLSPEQDWHPGTLKLCLGLEFIPTIF